MTASRHDERIEAMNSKHSDDMEWAAGAVRWLLVRLYLRCGLDEAAQERAGR